MNLGGVERRTLFLVNLAAIMESADMALLPAVYKEVGRELHASPTGLGSLTLFRSIVQCACYPLAAYLATRHNRTHVIALGAFLWAAATFLVAVSGTFLQVAISRAFNGVGLALAIPAIQSLVADSTDERSRGTAFGWLQLTSHLGSMIGSFFALLLASTTFMGIPGWRVAFHVVAIISVVIGLLIRLFAVDPHILNGSRPANGHVSGQNSTWKEVKDMFAEAKSVIKIPSFQIIVAQGIVGSFPLSSLSFAPMWLELVGFSHEGTGIIMSLFIVAYALGGLMGGMMGDFMGKRFPDSGRVVLAQISDASGIPLAALLLLVLPDDPSTGIQHGLVIFIMGLCISWNAAGTNNPIFAEIVPEKARTSIYALDRSFETVLSSFAPTIVGVLAERVYGYKLAMIGQSDHSSPKVDRENAASLAKALFIAVAIPKALCGSIYSFLYCTYPRDRERARMDSLIASELEQIESENAHHGEMSELQLGNQRSMIDIVDEGEDLETDGSDVRKLLSNKVDLPD